MNLLAFYAVRGYKPDELANLGSADKLFLGVAREQYYTETAEMLAALFGGKGG